MTVLDIYVLDEERATTVAMSLSELFRTVRVVAEAKVFLEPSPGSLVNIDHIVRIIEHRDDGECAAQAEAQRSLDEYDAAPRQRASAIRW